MVSFHILLLVSSFNLFGKYIKIKLVNIASIDQVMQIADRKRGDVNLEGFLIIWVVAVLSLPNRLLREESRVFYTL